METLNSQFLDFYFDVEVKKTSNLKIGGLFDSY